MAVLAAVLVAAAIDDSFGARAAWLYATILTTGYLVSRGLAKSGSPEPRDDERTDRSRGRPRGARWSKRSTAAPRWSALHERDREAGL